MYLLTVNVPVGAPRHLAVQYDLHIAAGSEMILPGAIISSDRHPADISGTSPVDAVDVEVTVVLSNNGKVVLLLGPYVRPGVVSQSGEREPVELV